MPSWSKRANRTKTPVEILALILPVFAVVIVGYLAVKFSIVPASIAPPLVQFVYHICLPALMFHIIAGESIHALLNWRFWIAFGGGSLLMLGLVYVGGGRWLGKDFGDKAIPAFSAVQINAAFVALPVLHVIFGAKGVAPAAIANFIVAAVMFPILAAVMEMTRRTGSGGKKPMWHLARGVFLSPMVWPAVLGFVFAAFAIPVPKTLDSFLVILGSALTPVALFAIGASVNLGDILHDARRIAVLSTIKLVALPALVFGIALALGMEPFFIIAVTICACVPTAKNIYFLASEYHVAEKSAAAMISATTVASIVTMTLWLLLLATLYPSVFKGTV